MANAHILLGLRGGGLGNQLFQYSAGLKLALDSGCPLLIDTSEYAPSSTASNRWARSYLLDQFRITSRVSSAAESNFMRGRSLWSRCRRAPDFFRAGGQAGLIIELKRQHRRPHPALTNSHVRRRIMMVGYFECAVYPESIEPRVREELRFRDPPNQINADFIARMQSVNSVAIHVRGGDLLDDPEQRSRRKQHQPAFLQNAIDKIISSVPNPEFFIFSDSIHVARAALSLHNLPTHFITHNGNAQPVEDLRLISSCMHHILAPSTFGWWGAWLGKNPGQIVIAPKEYFSGGEPPVDHYYPKQWILL